MQIFFVAMHTYFTHLHKKGDITLFHACGGKHPKLEYTISKFYSKLRALHMLSNPQDTLTVVVHCTII